MKPVENYKKWLSAVAAFYGVPEADILRSGKKNDIDCGIRNIFFTLCLRDNINLYFLSSHLGLHRTTIRKSLIEFRLNTTGEVNKILNHLKNQL